MHGHPPADADIAAAFQQAAIDCVIDRTRRALALSRARSTALVVAGGVAANAGTARRAGRAGRMKHRPARSSRRRRSCARITPR